MKKMAALLLVLVMILGMTTCAFADDKIKVGVAFANQKSKRFDYDAAYMKEVCDAAGAELIVQWANYDEEAQDAQVDNMISQGIDVLILVAVNSNMSPLVAKVKGEGIPVVCYDNYIINADLDAYLDRDNFAGGVMQMQMTMDAIGGEGNIVIIHGEPTSSVVKGFKEGYDSVLAKYPNVKVVAEQYCPGYSAETALQIAENAITANGDSIKAFVCTADVLSVAILPTLEESGLAGKAYVTGLDCETPALQALIDGSMGMTIWTDIKACATRAAEIALALAKGETFKFDETVQNGDYEIPKIFVPMYAITKDNLKQFVDEIAPTGWISWDELKLDAK